MNWRKGSPKSLLPPCHKAEKKTSNKTNKLKLVCSICFTRLARLRLLSYQASCKPCAQGREAQFIEYGLSISLSLWCCLQQKKPCLICPVCLGQNWHKCFATSHEKEPSSQIHNQLKLNFFFQREKYQSFKHFCDSGFVFSNPSYQKYTLCDFALYLSFNQAKNLQLGKQRKWKMGKTRPSVLKGKKNGVCFIRSEKENKRLVLVLVRVHGNRWFSLQRLKTQNWLLELFLILIFPYLIKDWILSFL